VVAAAADPFQKFVHDVLQFSQHLMDQYTAEKNEAIANAAPDLVKSMHEVAARKRELARSIREYLNEPATTENTGDLSRQAGDLDDSVRGLVSDMERIDPNWTAHHSGLNRDVDNMVMEKASADRQGLYYMRKGGDLKRSDALKFADRLDQLADQLDKIADRVAAAVVSDNTSKAHKKSK